MGNLCASNRKETQKLHFERLLRDKVVVEVVGEDINSNSRGYAIVNIGFDPSNAFLKEQCLRIQQQIVQEETKIEMDAIQEMQKKRTDGQLYSRIEDIQSVQNNYHSYEVPLDDIYLQELQPKMLRNTKYFIHVRQEDTQSEEIRTEMYLKVLNFANQKNIQQVSFFLYDRQQVASLSEAIQRFVRLMNQPKLRSIILSIENSQIAKYAIELLTIVHKSLMQIEVDSDCANQEVNKI